MRCSKIILSGVLSSLLLFSGCSSGGGSGGSSESSEVSEYHQKIAEGFTQNSSRVLREDGLIDIALDIQYTSASDSDFISLTKKYDEELDVILKQNSQLLLDAMEFHTLHPQSTYIQSIYDESATKQANVRSAPQKRFVVVAVGVGLLAYSFSKLFSKAGDAIVENSRNNILNIAATDEAGRREMIKLMNSKGAQLRDSASVSDIQKATSEITVNNLTTVSREGLAYAHNDYSRYVDVFASARELMPRTVAKIGEVAVEAVVTGNSGVTGSVGGLLPNKTVGIAVDVVTTVSSTDPLSLINNNVSATAVSQEKEKIDAQLSVMTVDEAKAIVNQMAKKGAGDIKVGDLEESKKAINADLAVKDGDGDDTVLSVPVYATTQNYKLEEQKKLNEDEADKESGTLKINEEYKYNNMDILISNGEEIDHTITDVMPALDTEVTVMLEAKVEASMQVSATKVSSDKETIVYNVTATLKGVKDATKVTLSLSNASTSSATKTINSDGTLSWSVIVLQDDATITITRADTGESETIALAGTGEAVYSAYVELYDGVITSVVDNDDEDNIICLASAGDEYSAFMDASGYLYDADGFAIIGSINGSSVSVNIGGADFSGNLSGGTWSDHSYCSGTWSGGYASLATLKSYQASCNADYECKNSQAMLALDQLIAYKESL